MGTSRMGWVDRRQLHDRALEVLQPFNHPDVRPETPVADLSIAARQIVETCRALAARARIILMDEPTSSLPRSDVDRLFGLVRKLKREGISVVYISHFLEEVREIADSFTVLRDGRSVANGRIAAVNDDELIGPLVGRSVENLFPQPPRPQSSDSHPILEVRALSAPPLLKQASFELRRGEIFGLAGLMGSGRTPLVRALFGLDKAESGTIVLRGKVNSAAVSARGGTPAKRLRQRFGYLSEDRKDEGLALPVSVA